MKNTAFYIAKRYLLAKKGNTAVTIITWLAVFVMMFAVSAMFVIVSVFSGLEDLNRDLISNLHADITISSASGKTLPDIKSLEKILKTENEIQHYSKIIDEKIYVVYKDIGEIAYLRGVDSAYVAVNPIDKNIFYGTYPSFKYENEVLMENSLGSRLAIPVNSTQDAAMIYIPKAGSGIINKEEDIFNKEAIVVSGIFPGNDQMNNFIISPIELAQKQLNLPKNAAYQIVIKLKNDQKTDFVKQNLNSKLGKNYVLKTKEEENAAFWKMINTEKLMIYLIFALVIFITTFNLAGAIIILQLDKKDQAKSLISLGFNLKNLRKTYFYTGFLIVIFGIATGLFFGTFLCAFQLKTHFFMASENLPFPIKIVLKNYFIVALVAAFFGLSVSWIFSKINKENLMVK
jgi:lipoprotein-releasing system permease protein